jgi:hypothetical protein
MTYIGIIVDENAFIEDPITQSVDIGYGVNLPLFYFIQEFMPNFNRPESWLNYMCNRLSWPGMKLADKVICKIC